jgi:hypothetical protein
MNKRLTQLMMERLCVVATSVPSERVLSKMGLIISERRGHLAPSKAQQMMFLNANLNIQASPVSQRFLGFLSAITVAIEHH